MKNETLLIEVLTYSSIDLDRCGAHKYINSPDFDLMAILYHYNNKKDIELYDNYSKNHDIPESLIKDLNNPKIIKLAYDVNFTMNCIKARGIETSADQWECLYNKYKYYNGVVNVMMYPFSFKSELTDMFTKPYRSHDYNEPLIRITPFDDKDSWQQFLKERESNFQDEVYASSMLHTLYMTDTEKQVCLLDQKINDTGIGINKNLAAYAAIGYAEENDRISKEIIDQTGVKNPNSSKQIIKWINKVTGFAIYSLNKDEINNIKKQLKCFPIVINVIDLQKKLSMTSLKKYDFMLECMVYDSDNKSYRIKDLFKYNEAITGRWSSERVQIQNLPRGMASESDYARELVINGDFKSLKVIYGDINTVLSQLIRTTFEPAPGHSFAIADFSAIEARVISWLSNEDWRMEVFRGDGKIYEEMASRMFNIPVEQIAHDSIYREKGKTADLAFSFGGGVNSVTRLSKGHDWFTPMEMEKMRDDWRAKNPKIVEMWSVMYECAKKAINIKNLVTTPYRNIKIVYSDNVLEVMLPSGRGIFYGGVTIKDDNIYYTSDDGRSVYLYGGKFIENIVQAIARDILAEAMLRVDRAGYNIVMHVHDELVSEIDNSIDVNEQLNDILNLMKVSPSWIADLPLNAKGCIAPYYKK